MTALLLLSEWLWAGRSKVQHNGHRSPKIQIDRKRHEVFVFWSWSL